MNITSKKLPKSQVELTIEIPIEELGKYLDLAAQKISKEKKFDGFRPGKVPYEIIKQKLGEMVIYQEALNPLIGDTLLKALEQEKLKIIGRPDVDVEKLAAGNPIVYKAVVSLMPNVKIKNYKNIKIKPAKIEIGKEKIEKTLEQLQKMRAKEALDDKAIELGDKAVIDFSIYLDKVPIENGQHKNYPIYLGENFFVPGFEENIFGMKAGEEKEFELKFPKDYFQKNIAGKLAEIKVQIKDVYKVEKPELNDEFAKMINFENMEKLNEQIEKNIAEEEEFKDEQRMEMEIFDEIIKLALFDDFPQMLIDSELDKMISELRYNVLQQGVEFETYIAGLKTSIADLKKSFLPQAEKRLKISLILKEIALLENIAANEEDIKSEIDKLLKVYPDAEAQKNIKSENYKYYLENALTNQKIVEKLKEWNVEK
ncbi:MAG: trigger factor [bacterium]